MFRTCEQDAEVGQRRHLLAKSWNIGSSLFASWVLYHCAVFKDLDVSNLLHTANICNLIIPINVSVGLSLTQKSEFYIC